MENDVLLKPSLEIRPSAYKHGYTEQDIRAVFNTYFLNKPLTGRDGVELLLGFSAAGETLELMYEVSDTAYVVFHVMKCRKQFIEFTKKR
jgi:hypothetical protein